MKKPAYRVTVHADRRRPQPSAAVRRVIRQQVAAGLAIGVTPEELEDDIVYGAAHASGLGAEDCEIDVYTPNADGVARVRVRVQMLILVA